jgi:3-phosphoshikimate 1-carboxyvinyltransferase
MTSEGYFALTRRWVERAGFDVTQTAQTLTPTLSPAGEREGIEFPAIPGDWSSLGYLLALSWVSGLPVERLAFDTGHPDEALATHLRAVGLSITDRLTGTPTRGFDVDCEQCPDAIPTLAVLATKLPSPSRFRRPGILRHKESDRLDATQALLRAAGLSSELGAGLLTVHPGTAHAFTFSARDDHRMAMSAAVLARLHGVSLTLDGKDCVSKSFPTFWREAEKAGVRA